jgi:tRNA(Arg) A34 adenosine deaminase TadA
MRLALDEARRGNYPIGAVIVRDGKVIARGRDLGKVHDDPTAHAEMTAMRRALTEHGSAALTRQHALRDRRAVPHVHGRDYMVPCRPARFRGVHKAIGHQD